MRHGDEPTQVLEWLYATLSTDPVLAGLAGVETGDFHTRVWPDVAPSDVAEPFLVYSVTEALDQGVLGAGARVFTTVPATVRWVMRADQADTGGAAQRRLYAVLHGAHTVPVADGGVILTARRTTALHYAETANGTDYLNVGAVFAVEVN